MTSEPITLSNSIRLTGRQWLGIAGFALLFAFLAPSLWELVEAFPLEDDYRIPRELKQDYWLYQRFSRLAASKYDNFVVGDSVVWGVFARRPETLPHYLNQQAGGERFANFGMIGAHPLALEGLVRHYAPGIAGKNVVLQCNLLWLTTPKEDMQIRLTDETADAVFHAGLVPQFWPDLPRYRQPISKRLGILIQQRVLPVSQLANHLQQAYYGQEAIPTWTMAHPEDNPIQPLLRGLPPSDNVLEQPQVPWFANAPKKKGPPKEDVPWVDMDTSLQWPAFQRVVSLLQSRGNRVFVVVGPFNEHMLTDGSRRRCQHVKETIAAWLKTNEVPHVVAKVLPTRIMATPAIRCRAAMSCLAQRLWVNVEFQAMVR